MHIRLYNQRAAVRQSNILSFVPIWTEVGNVVLLLAGSQFPLVLRPLNAPSESTYTIVGPAYLHEMMNGEVYLAQWKSFRGDT
jgi:hypothetical protein